MHRSHTGAILAGLCLGLAFWVKYPILIFLPVYLLLAFCTGSSGRRAWLCLLAFLAAIGLLFLPYLGEFHTLYRETVVWQAVARYRTPADLRVETAGIFWLLINPFAVVALVRLRRPIWPAVGFAMGSVFVFTVSTYSHYFVLVAPFAALLGAPVAAQLIHVPRLPLAAGCLILTTVCAGLVRSLGNDYGLVIANHFSDIRPIVQYIDRATPAGTPILASRIQYPYLADRPWIDHYFWDDSTIVSAPSLEQALPGKGVVVLDPWTDWFLFPTGLTAYLTNCKHFRLGGATIWRLSECSSIPGRLHH